jgi:hypothetical protein
VPQVIVRFIRLEPFPLGVKIQKRHARTPFSKSVFAPK